MNSLDLYDFTVPDSSGQSPSPENKDPSPSSSTAAAEISRPSLNEEVTQVMGQLGRFWGGVRKQSQSAFESARKDLGQVVSQAQRELEKLGQRPARPPTESVSSDASEEKDSTLTDAAPDTTSPSNPSSESPPVSVPASSSFFSLLQNSLPPNLTPTALSSTLQRHLPENLRHGLNFENATADFTQLRATLAENIQRVQQGTTVQQAERLAEQYMHKGEMLVKEAGEFLKDAVKVLPPEEGSATGVVWDGSDVWPMPPLIQTNVGRGASRKGKNRESDVLFSVPRAAAKRTDTLLKKLRNDPEALRKDPEQDEDPAMKQAWLSFIQDEVEAKGGVNGEAWTARISTALEGHDEDEDARALTVLRDELVPAELDNNVFWPRYFFRVRQIERDEEQRKALLAGASQDEDDFTWEDEDEGEGEDDDDRQSLSQAEKTPVNASSATVHTTLAPPADPAVPAAVRVKAPSLDSQTPVCVSPRESDDSYDVVSSGNVSSTGGKAGEMTRRGEKGGDDGDESDWE